MIFVFSFFRSVGLTLDELYFYMNDPWWRLLRRGIFISFWILFFAIFASTCIISVIEDKQRCNMSVKSLHSPIDLYGADEIPRINYTLAVNTVPSNLSMATFISGASTMQ